jgi:rSAM/selenodomain-associated transferase 2
MEFGVNYEIIVSDGGSSDNTVALAEEFKVRVIKGLKGRAKQMNAAARHAQGEILYFLHADSRTPSDFIGKIVQANARGYQAGCFRLRFDWNHWFLKLNAWFTRFDINAVRFGDQSLFITKKLFDQIGGFREDYTIMEDQEIVNRITRNESFTVLSDFIITSARKYRINGAYRMQIIFFYIYFAYAFGASQETLQKIYCRLIKA